MYLKITLQSQYQGSEFNPGPFNIVANPGGYTFNGITKPQLISGYYIDVPNTVTGGTITSNGYCTNSINWTAPIMLPTPTPTQTLTQTVGLTQTPTSTPTPTQTLTQTVGLTQTPTPTNTQTPTIVLNYRAIMLSNPPGEVTSSSACGITTGLTKYIDFTNEISSGVIIYNDINLTEKTYNNDPYLGNYAMLYDPIGANGINGGKRYSISFDNTGVINYHLDCNIALPTHTPTPTQTQTPTLTYVNFCREAILTTTQEDLDNSDDNNVYYEYRLCNGDLVTRVRGVSGTFIECHLTNLSSRVYKIVGGLETAPLSSSITIGNYC